MTKKRSRTRIEMWLNPHDEFDAWMLDAIVDLKAARQFARTMRDALRLIVSLQAGQTDVLYDLFPWVQYKQVALPPPPAYTLPRRVEGDVLSQIEEVMKEELQKVSKRAS